MVAHSNGKTWTRCFGPKNPELLPENLNLNESIFFKLLLTELDKKMASASYRKTKNENTAERADNIMYTAWLSTWKWRKNLTLDKFSLRSQQLVPNYLLYPLLDFKLSNMCTLNDFNLCLLLKSTFFINNRGFSDRYIIVMLRDGASFFRPARLLNYTCKPSNFVLQIFTLTGNSNAQEKS